MYTVAVILLAAWLLGISSHMHGSIHLLAVLSMTLVLLRVYTARPSHIASRPIQH